MVGRAVSAEDAATVELSDPETVELFDAPAGDSLISNSSGVPGEESVPALMAAAQMVASNPRLTWASFGYSTSVSPCPIYVALQCHHCACSVSTWQ